MTRTYATLEVTRAAFAQISDKLREAGYDHAFDSEANALDMHGIGLVAERAAPPADSYVDAFFDTAKILGIGALPMSPKEAFETVIRQKLERIVATAHAVVTRWDEPSWKDVPATGYFIYALRNALAGAVAEAPASLIGYSHDPKRRGPFCALPGHGLNTFHSDCEVCRWTLNERCAIKLLSSGASDSEGGEPV